MSLYQSCCLARQLTRRDSGYLAGTGREHGFQRREHGFQRKVEILSISRPPRRGRSINPSNINSIPRSISTMKTRFALLAALLAVTALALVPAASAQIHSGGFIPVASQ